MTPRSRPKSTASQNGLGPLRSCLGPMRGALLEELKERLHLAGAMQIHMRHQPKGRGPILARRHRLGQIADFAGMKPRHEANPGPLLNGAALRVDIATAKDDSLKRNGLVHPPKER